LPARVDELRGLYRSNLSRSWRGSKEDEASSDQKRYQSYNREE
jgi:hypothetical protein